MSDATGFASGGTTNQLIVGNTVANNNCSTAVLSPPYTFQFSTLPLTQCSQFTVVVDSGAVLPITIAQLIPGGQPVVFNSNSDTFTSVVDVNQGTNLVYFVTDSEGRQGGVSGFEQVLGSSNSSCLSANSPSSTAGISATSTASPTSSSSSPSSSSSSSPSSNSSQSNIAVIAGAVGGGGAVLIALVIFGMCLWRKRRASRSLDVQSPTTSHLQRTDPKYEASPYSDIPSPFTFPYQTNPLSYHTRSIQPSLGTQSDLTNSSMSNFVAGAPPSSFNQVQHSRQSSNADSAFYGDARSSTMSSAYNRMAALSQPMSADYPAQYPAGYLPVRPGSQSPPLSTSTGNFTASDRPTLHSRQSSNADSAAYGDARSSAAMSSVDRRMTTVAEAWETNPVSHLGLPIQSGSQPNPVNAPAADLTARDLLPTVFNQTQPYSSNTDFAVYGDARISDMIPVEHMAAGARPASPLPRKTVPVYITPPVQPGSQLISTSAGKVAASNPPTPFNQTQNSRQGPNADSLAVYGASGGQTAYQLPTRIIVHTDADDVVPDDNGLVELPPQYSDHRGVRA
ncbi:hypothetical protein F4604DRAFT_1746187 [Suillus subluteus]|nr:hypothetical protein F4604DRAFT_1746187 [Suillus subluteus]